MTHMPLFQAAGIENFGENYFGIKNFIAFHFEKSKTFKNQCLIGQENFHDMC